ncbi:hypothetical protein FM105_00200 [Brevibacterium yomogidense]|uniref:Uncharacterized protein n=1 Tax=Brevibacterium yomogidense TaxID=946573 RepID=A0A1X6WTG5_9MICO|nr:hypothetical protein FM105_00200 [Brevibacterium yomogidense]
MSRCGSGSVASLASGRGRCQAEPHQTCVHLTQLLGVGCYSR